MYAVQIGWITSFWVPGVIRGDNAFKYNEFVDFANNIGSKFEAIQLRRHQKNVLELKHKVLRSIFIRLSNDDIIIDEKVRIALTFDISNQLYGSDVMSAYEMARGFTKPIAEHPTKLPDELYQTQNVLNAKRKLTRILRSKSPSELTLSPGDLVEIYIRKPNQKRVAWTSPAQSWKVMLSLEQLLLLVVVVTILVLLLKTYGTHLSTTALHKWSAKLTTYLKTALDMSYLLNTMIC